MSFRHQAVGAYRRWEPPSFDAREPESEPESEPEPLEPSATTPASVPEPETPAFKLPTADDIEKIHDAAHKDGYAAGYEEGTARGGCTIEAEGAMVDATVQTRWRRIMETMNADDIRWDPKD
ncbi:FliH/SctL family protein [Denitromonas ohlonensis]|uniref:Flagellar assembly protein FliH n=1 Tax=Denitromonas ohlonensis TaxID=3078508 RepID=A0ABY3EY20_9RHOO|nr:FliH/SctL family protein [Denitromonas ohlonensis]TVO63049.1 hypothetical protein FHP90_15135 [Denitromonas ohlonensis]